MSNIALDKYISNLVGSGELVGGAAFLSTVSGVPLRTRNVILAQKFQKGTSLKLAEAISILDGTLKNSLHFDYVVVGDTQYLITSVQERSYYGRNIDVEVGGGVIIQKTTKCILVVTYPQSSRPEEVIPFLDRYIENFPQ